MHGSRKDCAEAAGVWGEGQRWPRGSRRRLCTVANFEGQAQALPRWCAK